MADVTLSQHLQKIRDAKISACSDLYRKVREAYDSNAYIHLNSYNSYIHTECPQVQEFLQSLDKAGVKVKSKVSSQPRAFFNPLTNTFEFYTVAVPT